MWFVPKPLTLSLGPPLGTSMMVENSVIDLILHPGTALSYLWLELIGSLELLGALPARPSLLCV